MKDTVIKIEKLSKRYTLGGNEPYYALRDQLANIFNLKKSNRAKKKDFWALKNVNLEIKRGEAVGIIGRNGAGKSTLLKILSQITPPTEGKITIEGRVASLLEIGTGFNPELTGRENIFLNGAILGMSRAEIKRKFDEIIAFSEIEKFLDTPVKRYSSGMYVRLAFAVAAHLEPEILLVDEVLAVGDAQFQKKCLGKMSEVGKHGRTVVFVSHNMAAIANLCSRCIYLESGKIEYIGDTKKAIDRYISQADDALGIKKYSQKDMPKADTVRLESVRIVSGGKMARSVYINKEVHIEISYACLKKDSILHPVIHLRDELGSLVFASADFASANSGDNSWYGKKRPVGNYKSTCVIPANFLNDSTYHLDIGIVDEKNLWKINELDILSFTVEETGEMKKEYMGQWTGAIRPKLKWETVVSEKGANGIRKK